VLQIGGIPDYRMGEGVRHHAFGWSAKSFEFGRSGTCPTGLRNKFRDLPKLSKRGLEVKKRMFDELLGSGREGGAILRGERKAARRMVVRSSGVRVIRERTGLSQAEFA
jgi:hypothetical protein